MQADGRGAGLLALDRVADEVSRNRSVSRGPGKGGRAGEAPGDACARLLSAALLQRLQAVPLPLLEALAGRVPGPPGPRRWPTRSCRRRARVDRDEREFESMMAAIRSDVRAGLPARIAAARAGQFEVSASTIYRWIERGTRECRASSCAGSAGTRGARAAGPPRVTARGERARSRRSRLPDEERGLLGDGHCDRPEVRRSVPADAVPAPCKFQLALLMPGKDAASTEGALDALEKVVGKAAFARMFGPRTLTDNGP